MIDVTKKESRNNNHTIGSLYKKPLREGLYPTRYWKDCWWDLSLSNSWLGNWAYTLREHKGSSDFSQPLQSEFSLCSHWGARYCNSRRWLRPCALLRRINGSKTHQTCCQKETINLWAQVQCHICSINGINFSINRISEIPSPGSDDRFLRNFLGGRMAQESLRGKNAYFSYCSKFHSNKLTSHGNIGRVQCFIKSETKKGSK